MADILSDRLRRPSFSALPAPRPLRVCRLTLTLLWPIPFANFLPAVQSTLVQTVTLILVPSTVTGQCNGATQTVTNYQNGPTVTVQSTIVRTVTDGQRTSLWQTTLTTSANCHYPTSASNPSRSPGDGGDRKPPSLPTNIPGFPGVPSARPSIPDLPNIPDSPNLPDFPDEGGPQIGGGLPPTAPPAEVPEEENPEEEIDWEGFPWDSLPPDFPWADFPWEDLPDNFPWEKVPWDQIPDDDLPDWVEQERPSTRPQTPGGGSGIPRPDLPQTPGSGQGGRPVTPTPTLPGGGGDDGEDPEITFPDEGGDGPLEVCFGSVCFPLPPSASGLPWGDLNDLPWGDDGGAIIIRPGVPTIGAGRRRRARRTLSDAGVSIAEKRDLEGREAAAVAAQTVTYTQTTYTVTQTVVTTIPRVTTTEVGKWSFGVSDKGTCRMRNGWSLTFASSSSNHHRHCVCSLPCR